MTQKHWYQPPHSTADRGGPRLLIKKTECGGESGSITSRGHRDSLDSRNPTGNRHCLGKGSTESSCQPSGGTSEDRQNAG